MTPSSSSYVALALQTKCYAVNAWSSRANARGQMLQTVDRISGQIEASKTYIGPDLKLVVLPEYFLSGFPMGESFKEWQNKACIEMDGEVYAALKAAASTNQVYLSGNVYELDPNFPELYFQASFIISPEGNLLLRYRRLNSMYTPTPHDVLDKYLEIYGPDSLFPVADTPLGRLACIVSDEILYPEIARCLALRGAEILCHSSSEAGSAITNPRNIAKMARAFENMAYVVSANNAGITCTAIPESSTEGHSQVVHFEGHKLCEALAGESMAAYANIHIQALRQFRVRPGLGNLLARQRNELFATTYNRSIQPANGLLKEAANRSFFLESQQQTLAALVEQGILRQPD